MPVHSSKVSFLILLSAVCLVVQSDDGCSRQLPSYNESSQNQFNSSGIQLLIPSWNFTCLGFVEEWTAHVTGNTSLNGVIEFQIFEPDPNNSDTYHLVYGNEYKGDNANGTKITRVVDSVNKIRIPVSPGYIVGIYLRPSVSNDINLLYESEGDVDVYYWENVDNNTCNYTLCSGRVMRNINPLVGWSFFSTSVLTSTRTAFEFFRSNNGEFCHGSISQCRNDSDDTPDNLSSSNTIIPVTAVQSQSGTLFTTSTQSNTSILLTHTYDNMPSKLLTAHMSLFINRPTESSSLSSTESSSHSSTTSTNTQQPPTNTNPLQVDPELIAAFSVVLFLFVIALILIITISVCCCLKRKPITEASVANGFDNPDYYGVVSSCKVNGNTEGEPLELQSFHTEPVLSPALRQTTVSPSPQLDVNQYDVPFGVQTKPDRLTSSSSIPSPSNIVNKPLSTTSQNNLVSSPLISASSNDKGYLSPNDAILSPSASSLESKSHLYSSPTTDISNVSFPMTGGVYDTIDENEPVIPSSNDPDMTPCYDQIEVLDQKASISPKTKDDNMVYAYVPTNDQRKVLDWRYQLPMDQDYNKLTFFEEQSQFWAPASTASGLYEQLASNKYREIPREKIVVSNVIGQGQFGYVSKGMWASPDGRHEVAIKTLKPDADDNEKLKLLQEAAIMGQFSHKNVVKVEGVVTVGDPIMLVLEYVPRGDLRTYLRSIKQATKSHPPPNLPKLLLKFCRDISCGMRYLSRKSFVHRDLAARNVLLSRQLTCKIGDFGMARDLMQDDNNYYTSSGGIIPIKWTAPEAINFRKYSTDSDVWSYGMILFEIWSLGRKPFSELSNPIVIALINSKHCQAPPPGCPRPMYKLMVDCWNPEHSKRPPFSQILTHLDSSSDSLLGWNKEDNIRGHSAHILGAPLEESSDLYVDLQRVYQQSMLQSGNGRQRSKSNY